MLALVLSGCYASHVLHNPEPCREDCEMYQNRCQPQASDFNLDECLTECESPDNLNVLFPDCADCLVTQAMCQQRYFVEFCSTECGL